MKRLSILLRGIALKSNGDYYCVICLYSFRTTKKLESHEDVFKDLDYCQVKTSEDHSNILKFNHEQKSFKISFFIYVETESLLKKNIHMC